MSYPPGSNTMTIKLVVLLGAAVTIGAVSYFMMKDKVESTALRELPTSAVVQPAAIPAANKTLPKPVYEEPLPVPQLQPLPDLNQSDVAVVSALQGLNVDGLLPLVIPEEVLRKFVRAVDAVEEGRLINEYRPIVSPQGALAVESFHVSVAGGELGSAENVEQFRLSAKNYQRYDVYSRVLTLLNSETLVAMYKRFYPLLNEAYKEMGSTKGNFHSVLVRAIDHILAAPDASGEIILIHPKVYFEFADPVLEKLPATHKLMLRMGPENASRVKASLQSLRNKLVQH